MILNANIPLNTTSSTRWLPWRVGIFLGIFFIGTCVGWGVTKQLSRGITIPIKETPSGIAIRLTPENILWLSKHTNSLILTENCPVDLPTLIYKTNPSWILLGDTGSALQVTVIGKTANTMQAFITTQGCDISFQQKKNKKIALSPSNTWAWTTKNIHPLTLQKNSITWKTSPTQIPKEKLPWPQENIISALPLSTQPNIPFSLQLQGISDLFIEEKEGASFTWEQGGDMQYAFAIKGDISDELFLNLIYDLNGGTKKETRALREDDISYTTTKNPSLTIIEKGEGKKEIAQEDGVVRGYQEKHEQYTLISTKRVTWKEENPHWQADLGKKQKTFKHEKQTLAQFGKRIFITKKIFTLLGR